MKKIKAICLLMQDPIQEIKIIKARKTKIKMQVINNNLKYLIQVMNKIIKTNKLIMEYRMNKIKKNKN